MKFSKSPKLPTHASMTRVKVAGDDQATSVWSCFHDSSFPDPSPQPDTLLIAFGGSLANMPSQWLRGPHRSPSSPLLRTGLNRRVARCGAKNAEKLHHGQSIVYHMLTCLKTKSKIKQYYTVQLSIIVHSFATYCSIRQHHTSHKLLLMPHVCGP